MLKTNITKKTFIISLLAVVITGAAVAYYAIPGYAQSVQQLEGEINQLENEIKQSKDRLSELRDKEDTLKNKLEIIKTDINKIQKELQQTRDDIATKEAEIRKTERELQRKKELMQENAKTLYKEGDPSTMEILFSSDSFSDFMSRKQYLDSVKDSLNDAAREVKELQKKLKDEKTSLEQKRQKQANKELALQSRRNEQQQLLEETRGKETRYQELVAEQQQELEQKIEQQRQAYAAAAQAWGDNYITAGGYGNYRWAGQGLSIGGCSYDSDVSGQDHPCEDAWSLYKGQCTSYVAWRLASEGYKVYDFEGMGHAAQWPSTTTNLWANRHGQNNAASRRSQPKAGYAAINPNLASPYGHVMYVEQVNSNGTIRISEYNFYQADTKSVRDIDPSGLIFLEFARQ